MTTLTAPRRRQLAVLSPLSQLRAGRLPRRLVQLAVGLTLYGTSMAMIVRSSLGLDPWDVLHYGLAARTGLSFGTVVILVGVVVLALWVPIRQLPGLGTVANVVVIGVVADAVLGALSTPDAAGRPRRAAGRRGACSTAWPARSTSAPSSAPARGTG